MEGHGFHVEVHAGDVEFFQGWVEEDGYVAAADVPVGGLGAVEVESNYVDVVRKTLLLR